MQGLIPASKTFFKKNGSTILTCFGAAGVIATAISAAKATPKALLLLEEAEKEKNEELTKLEKVRVAAPAYIPTMAIAATTITCICGANTISSKRQKQVVAAYSLLDATYKDYKSKVKEILGEEADRKVMHARAQTKYNDEIVPETKDEEVIFMDYNSLQMFPSTMDKVEEAGRIVNELLASRGYVYLNEYYELLGLKSIDDDYETGWSSSLLELSGEDHLEFIYDKADMGDGNVCYLIETSVEPTPSCMM